jgi:hypothetical protein
MNGANPHIRRIRVFFRAVAGRAGGERGAAEMVAVQVCYTRCGVQGNLSNANEKSSSSTAAPPDPPKSS